MGQGFFIKKIVYNVQLEPWRKGKRPVQSLSDDIGLLSRAVDMNIAYGDVCLRLRIEDRQEQRRRKIQKRQCAVILGRTSQPIRFWIKLAWG